MNHYILNADGTTTAVDLMTWARWMETADRHVGDYHRDGYRVSTVFLGLDHSFGKGPPLLFETMVFDDTREVREFRGRLYRKKGETLDCERYSTKDDALIGHERHVRKLDKMFDEAKLPATGKE